jgi:hypothetical protein
VRLSKALKKRGWTYVGPTTMYALMQATGMVNDHLKAAPAGPHRSVAPPLQTPHLKALHYRWGFSRAKDPTCRSELAREKPTAIT